MSKEARELVSCLIAECAKNTEYEKLLADIYRNNPHPSAKIQIEALAEKYKGDLKYHVDIIKHEKEN